MSLRCQGRRSVSCIEPGRSLRWGRSVCLDNCRKLRCPRCVSTVYSVDTPPWRALLRTHTHCVNGVCRRCSIEQRVPTFDTAARELGSLVVALDIKLPSSCLVRARATRLRSSRVHERSSLVDPASSHMLVSKIKPCMSQYMPN